MAGEYYVSKKYHEISVLAEEITKQISKNGEEWAKYLTTAAKLYKYPFEEQMLIYAQRPDATACATMETWNEKMSCWVNRGAKGIALFDRKSERPKLKYVFDVSDVHKARYIGKKPYLWEMGEEHKDVVLAQLEKTYGATDKNKSFENRLIEIAIRIAEDYYMEILPDLAYAKEGSFLEELDGLNIGVRLRDTLSSSIAYTLLSRCGADMDYWKEDLDFGYINEFNTTKTLSVIGNATANICKPLLMEIGRTVAAYDRQTARNKAKEKVNGIQTEQQSVQIPEKNAEIRKDENLSQISLANQSELRYNALKHKSDLHTKMDIPIYVAEEQSNKNKETEGSSYEPDIREERGLPDPQLDAKQRTGGSTDPIRADAQEVSGRTSQGDLQRDASGGQPESTLSGGTEPSRVENGCADGADGESRGSGRGTESVRPDAVGGNDEQYPTLGRGNRINGVGLPPLTSKGQQNIEMEKPDNDHKDGENSLSGSFLDNLQLAHDRMEIQKGILCFDQFLIHKRPEIAGYFAMEQDTDLQTEYLKNSFRMEEYTEFYLGENGRIRAGYYADEDGLTVWKGSYFHREAEARISWEDARYWVNSYIEDGVYLLPGEKAEQIDTSGMYRQLDLFSMFTEQVGSIAMKQAEQEIIPEKKEILPSKTAIPKEQLETILRSGGGRENSRKRIYAKYQQGKTSEEMTEFLKKEYGTTGKGFEFDEKQIAVWFDRHGMTVGYGTSALENPKLTMDWAEIECQIRLQVENGTYMSANEAYLVDEVEHGRIADHLFFFFRDGMGEIPEELDVKNGGIPDIHAKMKELLSTPEGIGMVASSMDKALAQLESGEKKLRFRSVMPKEELRAELDNLLLGKKIFPKTDDVEVKKENFITQDEIDYQLGRGSGFHYGSFRIYDYFMREHNSEEAVSFLKDEYGTGGSSHALAGSDHSWEDHDFKGIRLEKGSISDPYAKVVLPWNAVEKRIRKLIQEDKYLSPEGKVAFAAYKEEEAQKELEKAQEKMEHDIKVSCKNAIERAIAENFDGYRLPKGTAESVIKEYGTERVRYVLANSVMHHKQEEKISPENREWAKEIEPYAIIENRDMVVHSHPAILNGFINQTRRYIERELSIPQKETSGHGVNPSAQQKDLKSEPEKKEDSPLTTKATINALLTPDIEIPTKKTTPKIDKSGAVNFRITDDALDTDAAKVNTGFSPKEKFRKNIEAIRTLEKIEEEKRIATPEEQKILSQYVGWGGLADAFDKSKSAWAGEYQELKSLLSDREYASARESTLNAHYTSPVIIRSIYEALENMGFEKGNILEPAAGIGNFFGMLPEKMQDSRLYGVELDGITGRIAKQLYPKADIKISGFEKTDYPNDFFDVAVGNVPFGQYKVTDKAYEKHNFLIHDYFFAKALDKVRPGGVVAFVTSKGTMDKKSSEVRKYLAQRAELLGAVRLPNTAFKENAGTEVTSDILFLKKRDRVMDLEPDWVHLSENADGIAMNDYFVQHPEMIVGEMEMISGPYGMESTCQPDAARPFAEQLAEAVSRIEGEIEEAKIDELADDFADQSIPADPDVKNYSYALVDDKVYYRENSMMKPACMKDSMLERIKGMVSIRDCTQDLIRVQLEEYPDSVIKDKQAELNRLYDGFTKEYGLINSQTNKRAFHQDSSYFLLCSLEKTDEEGRFTGKADMFTKRTIKKAEVVTNVDTAMEALAVSLSEKAKVDLDYMTDLLMDGTDHTDGEAYKKTIDKITEELAGVIFKNPITDKWETADEYLSGNVRDKLETAKVYAENHPEFNVNVQALTQVQPKELDASEIEVRIGATWVKPEYMKDFVHDIFETPRHLLDKNIISIQFSDVTGAWSVKGKNADHGNTLVNMTYGTSRRNAYQILEDSLNLKDSRVYDTIEEDGREKRVLNKKETTLAAQKQDTIREAFKDWIFREPERRQDLVEKYNKLFNSTRPREYDGAHLKFPGMTPDITLKPHQKNAVAHVLYGDNTLLAHCVGAGKTFEMTAAAMESKRLGLCQKSLFVVPNHLTEQWASDFLRLYPGANILAATKKDFEPANRKKFCSRIATGDYDAVIIGHSQFEKIPLSMERQQAMIERQIDEIELAIRQAKEDNGERYTIKQMEKTKKSLLTRLEKLNDTSRKDNVVTFEQLGVDRLFVDESHYYKNLFLYTKMRNVAGIAQTEAQKSSDMFAKCQYLDEITGGKGVTFATGTPISNSMTELYTNMRYLQYSTLQKLGLGHFDSWASSFGETQTAIELAPEGTGYRAKTRFAKFFNLPELISIFKESADIQTPDMLKLPVPEPEYENVVLKPSDYQQDIVSSLADRAEAVRNRLVEPQQDNMLKITNDGRKLALDQRLINDMLPDNGESKAAMCVNKAFEIWEQTKEKKSAQLIFCDLSTPKNDGTFNVYEDVKNKLVEKGVPENEIAFIHSANTDTRKAELFGKVRSGQVRFLLGSTQKMGAGTNVQDRLIALHHLDVPWVRLEVA